MINADVTAENRPDCMRPHGKRQVAGGSYQNPISSTRMDTHKNQGGIQVLIVFLLEVPIVLFHFSLKLVVELHSGVDSGSGAAQYGPQGTAKDLLKPSTV